MLKLTIKLLIWTSTSISLTAQHHDYGDYHWVIGADGNPFQSHQVHVLNFEGEQLKQDTTSTNFEFTISSTAFSSNATKMDLFSNGYSIYDRFDHIIPGGTIGFSDSSYMGQFGWNDADGGSRVFGSILLLPFKNQIQSICLDDNINFDFPYNPWTWTLVSDDLKLITLFRDNFEQRWKGTSRTVLENKSMFAPMLSAIRHGNGRDWWVHVPYADVSRMCRVLVSENNSKVDTIPGSYPTYPEWQGDIGGQGVFSPDGKYYAHTFAQGWDGPGYDWGVALFSYDRCTGHMDLIELLPIDLLPSVEGGAGIAFAPNSRFLYFSDGFNLWQVDVLDKMPLSERQPIAYYDRYNLYNNLKSRPDDTDFLSYMQLGPDGRIYILATGGDTRNPVRFYHVIEYPDRKGKAAVFHPRGLILQGGTGNGWCMPNFPNYRLGPLDGSPCDTLGLNNEVAARFRYLPRSARHPLQMEFIDLSVREPQTWSWDFGDGTTSSESSPYHTFPAPGVFKVCLTVTNSNSSSTSCKMVPVNAPEAIVTGDDLRVYPNPWAEGDLNLVWDFEGPDGMDCPWTLFDPTGRRVHSGVITKKDQYPQLSNIPFMGYPPGIYFLSVYNPYRKKYTSVKVVIQE